MKPRIGAQGSNSLFFWKPTEGQIAFLILETGNMEQRGEDETGSKRHGVSIIPSVQAWSSRELAMGFFV